MHSGKGLISRRVFLAGSASGVVLANLGVTTSAVGVLGSTSRTKGRTKLPEPGPMLPPVPAILLTVKGSAGRPDEISVVWTFVVNGDPPQVGVSVDRKHAAQRYISEHSEFVLNVPVAEIVEPFDRIDMNTDKVADKFKLSGLTRGRAAVVDAPTVEECPIHVECRVFDAVDVPPTRKLFLAKVVATTVLDGVCDEAGRLIVPKVPFFGMTTGSGEFYTMGKRVGHIGQTVGRRDIKY